jgi:hypothetical protein
VTWVPPGWEHVLIRPGWPAIDRPATDGPENRGLAETTHLARDAAYAWREVMGDRRTKEQ